MTEEYTNESLKHLQSLPLDHKIQITIGRIMQWHNYFNGQVYVSFSGGKDSTVLLHLVRSIYPDIKAVFSNTGLEYPEIQSFAKSFPNVEVVTPKMRFPEVLTKYGYPLISKEVAEAIYFARKGSAERERVSVHPYSSELNYSERESVKDSDENPKQSRGELTNWRRRLLTGVAPGKTGGKSQYNKEKWLPLAVNAPFKISNNCCYVMKKAPIAHFQKINDLKPYIGTMTEESRLRKQAWLRHGCNAFYAKKQTSQPMSFWTEQDVLEYICYHGLEIAPVYGEIQTYDVDGKEVEPLKDIGYFTKDDDFVMGFEGCSRRCSGCQRTGCVFCGFGCHLEKDETRFQRLAKTHPKQYDYCMKGGQWVDNPDYDPTYTGKPDELGWIKWNPKQLWMPSPEGLGMKKVFEICNEMYGKDFIRYE